MATIVQHNDTGKHLVLVGTGYGAFQSNGPGDYLSKQYSGEMTVLACAFPDGKILWCDSKEVTVVEVDGQSPAAILSKYK